MSYSTITRAMVSYVESHVTDSRLDVRRMGQKFGFSENYIRELFAGQVGMSIMRYHRRRRIILSAAQLLHTDRNILDIALEWGFGSHEAYTRAFCRVIGMSPSDFRRDRPILGKASLRSGVYGLELLQEKEKRSNMDNRRQDEQNGIVLYDIQQVKYGSYGSATPFPICIKAVSEYLGDDVSYPYIMAATGAAFRLVWNTACWDLSNVDIYHAFNESNQVYGLGAKALGREFSFLGREESTTKEDFLAYIKEHLAEGYPCIALGIIGPPEPCIVAGYEEDGDSLLGWNFFQDDPEHAGGVSTAENGYFISKSWWENTDTQAVMCLGPINGEGMAPREILRQAVKALEGRKDHSYAKGILAYDAWREMLLEDSHFASEVYDSLFSKLLVQNDAAQCLADGREQGARYLLELAGQQTGEHNAKLEQAARHFRNVSAAAGEMSGLIGDWSDMDAMLRQLADRKVREQLAELILQAKAQDEAALSCLVAYLQE
ncbi:MAG: AraC family transcriptional regulator [bacterium]|nr:AraC family transcriptional regulator [bacterium]MCM1375089.1 AraC family transcriptional regulator [Muribaculum sp.]